MDVDTMGLATELRCGPSGHAGSPELLLQHTETDLRPE